jgi:hypothetical protein
LVLGVPEAWAQGVATVTIATGQGVAISPLLYGANYVWDKVPDGEFGSYEAAMSDVAGVRLERYLGGWGAEAYDWSSNTESGIRAAAVPGAGPEAFLASVPAASFITPSHAAVADPAAIGEVVRESVDLVRRYGGRVKYWEIGNEWWLQSGAANHPAMRAHNLRTYAQLLAAVVPAMKAADPSIVIFATADWTSPGDLAEMRAIAGPAWAKVDGISLHTYCGTLDPQRLCANLPDGVAAVRAASGKQEIYASEWSVTRGMNPDDEGIRNADLTIAALGEMVQAGISLGAYWPPVKVTGETAFVSADYGTPFATGVVFGWMSRYYEGMALASGGDLPAVAARDGGLVNVIVPSGVAPVIVRILLTGTGLHEVTSAAVLYTDFSMNGRAGRAAHIDALPTAIHSEDGKSYAEFELNPGTPGRGAGFEVARVSMN